MQEQWIKQQNSTSIAGTVTQIKGQYLKGKNSNSNNKAVPKMQEQ